jgi:hypothetical protein
VKTCFLQFCYFEEEEVEVSVSSKPVETPVVAAPEPVMVDPVPAVEKPVAAVPSSPFEDEYVPADATATSDDITAEYVPADATMPATPEYEAEYVPADPGLPANDAMTAATDVVAESVAAVEVDVDYHEGHGHSKWPASNFPAKTTTTTEPAPTGIHWTKWIFYILVLATFGIGCLALMKEMGLQAKFTWSAKRAKYMKTFWPKKVDEEELLEFGYNRY